MTEEQIANMVESMDDFELAPPRDLSYHFSGVTNQRVASKIKQFYKYFTIPGIANLAGGQRKRVTKLEY